MPMPSSAIKRCICGRSAQFPVCDGQHVADGWQCDVRAPVDTLIVATAHLRSVAERLAHALGAAASHQLSAVPRRVRRVLVLVDGHDLDTVLAQVASIRADVRTVIVVDAPASVGFAFAGWPVVVVAPESPLELWRALRAAVDLAAPTPSLQTPPRVFLSHAAADEERIEGPVAALRRRGVPVFVCADSIPVGTRWHARILEELARADRVVFIASAHSARSTFCAFELGFAVARGLPVRIVALDDAPIPPFVAHLQAESVPRLVRRRPWLSAPEALLDALWGALG